MASCSSWGLLISWANSGLRSMSCKHVSSDPLRPPADRRCQQLGPVQACRDSKAVTCDTAGMDCSMLRMDSGLLIMLCMAGVCIMLASMSCGEPPPEPCMPPSPCARDLFSSEVTAGLLTCRPVRESRLSPRNLRLHLARAASKVSVGSTATELIMLDTEEQWVLAGAAVAKLAEVALEHLLSELCQALDAANHRQAHGPHSSGSKPQCSGLTI